MDRNKIYNIGVEREGLRCDRNGKLSKLNHSEIFGNNVSREFITTDFGEAQIELRTPVCNNAKECYEKLESITDITLCELNKKNEIIWPYSIPCILPEEKDFPFGNYKDEEVLKYKNYLSKKYHYTKRAISGIHISFSLKEEYYKSLKDKFTNLPENVDEAYILIMKNYMKKVWMLTYLLAASPVAYDMKNNCVASIRNSVDGFKNLIPIDLSFENKKEHLNSIRKYIDNKDLYSLSELYYPIRAKAFNGSDDIDKLEKGISHIEVRVCDINPFDKCGVSKEQIEFTVAFLFACLFDKECSEYDYREISQKGLNDEQYKEILSEIKNISEINKLLDLKLENGINAISKKLESNMLEFTRIKKLVDENGYIETFIKLGQEYAEQGEKSRYLINAYPDLERSTVILIKEAILNGVDVNVLDEKKCIIELVKGNRRELVVQATRTSKDSSTLQYIANDKVVAKKIMRENGISVPEGIDINMDTDKDIIDTICKKYSNTPIVIKPKSTNFGTGITIFETGASQEQISNAIKFAAQFDNTVLIEKFVPGKEYRFLVINNKCQAITWRRNASVVGDGKSTIAELIEKKNDEYWHKAMHSHIENDNGLKEYFVKNKISMSDIPKEGERVTLRGNSNVSTGGESIDMTDIIPEYFKKIAEKVSESLNAKICGVDIIINDIGKEEYTVLEVNSNPGIYIHRWPYEGKERRIALEILKLLEMV